MGTTFGSTSPPNKAESLVVSKNISKTHLILVTLSWLHFQQVHGQARWGVLLGRLKLTFRFKLLGIQNTGAEGAHRRLPFRPMMRRECLPHIADKKAQPTLRRAQIIVPKFQRPEGIRINLFSL